MRKLVNVENVDYYNYLKKTQRMIVLAQFAEHPVWRDNDRFKKPAGYITFT